MKIIWPAAFALSAVVVLSSLEGCASAATSQAMTAEIVAPVHHSASAVTVAVAGGKETSAVGASQISNDAFAAALRDSIEKSGLFAKVADSGARYKLSGFIGKVDQPMFGLTLVVKMEVSYTLTDTQSATTVWTHDIASEHTSKFGDAAVAAKRLRLANEGAAKDNIQQAIAAIAALNLD